MSNSIAISNQAGIEYIISINEELREEVMFLSDDFPISMFTQVFKHEASDYIPLHWHNELQLTWVFEGELEYYINGDRVNISSDKIIIVNRDQMHSSKTINNNARTLCINFGLDFFHPLVLQKYISPLIANKGFSYHLLTLNPYQVRPLEKFLDWKKESIGYFSVINFLSQTFEGILDGYSNKHQNDEELKTFHDMISYIHENYSEPITVDDISSHALINKNRCTYIFRRYTKMSPIKYLNTYRLYIAKNMIIYSDKPISEICFDVGYKQISYFIEKFRSSFGFSPLKYRNKFGGLEN